MCKAYKVFLLTGDVIRIVAKSLSDAVFQALQATGFTAVVTRVEVDSSDNRIF